jgi:hypothetical protein
VVALWCCCAVLKVLCADGVAAACSEYALEALTAEHLKPLQLRGVIGRASMLLMTAKSARLPYIHVAMRVEASPLSACAAAVSQHPSGCHHQDELKVHIVVRV